MILDETQLEADEDWGDSPEEGGSPTLSPEVSHILGEAYGSAGVFTHQEVNAWLDQAQEKGETFERLTDVPKYIRQLLGLSPLDPGRDFPTRPDDPEYVENDLEGDEESAETEDSGDELDSDDGPVDLEKDEPEDSDDNDLGDPNDKLVKAVAEGVSVGLREYFANQGRNENREQGEQ